MDLPTNGFGWKKTPLSAHVVLEEVPVSFKPFSYKWRRCQEQLEQELQRVAVMQREERHNLLTMSGKPAGGKYFIEETEKKWIYLCRKALELGPKSYYSSLIQMIPDPFYFTLDIDITRDGYDNFFVRFRDEGRGLDPRCALFFILEELERLLRARGLEPSKYLQATVLGSHGRVNALNVKTSWRIFFWKMLFTRQDNRNLTDYLKKRCSERFGNHACNFEDVIDCNFGRPKTGNRAPYSHKVTRELCDSCKALKKSGRKSLPKNSTTCAFSKKCGLKVSTRAFVPAMIISYKEKERGWLSQESKSWEWFMSKCSVVPFDEVALLKPLLDEDIPQEKQGSKRSKVLQTPKRLHLDARPSKRKKSSESNRDVLEVVWSINQSWEKAWNSLGASNREAEERVALLLAPILGSETSVVSHKLQQKSFLAGSGRVVRVWQGLTESRTANCPMNDGVAHSTSRLSFNIYESGKIIVRCFMTKCDDTQACSRISHTGAKKWLFSSLQNTP